jgi:hypothetical protein
VFAVYSVPFLFQSGFQNRAKTQKQLMHRSFLVGVAGFEPATPSSRTRCATRLRSPRDGARRQLLREDSVPRDLPV